MNRVPAANVLCPWYTSAKTTSISLLKTKCVLTERKWRNEGALDQRRNDITSSRKWPPRNLYTWIWANNYFSVWVREADWATDSNLNDHGALFYHTSDRYLILLSHTTLFHQSLMEKLQYETTVSLSASFCEFTDIVIFISWLLPF